MIRYAKELREEITLVSQTRVRKETGTSQVDVLEFMQRLVMHFISNPDPTVVPVYSFEYLDKSYYGVHQYAYEMERLGELTRTEQKIIDLVGDQVSAGKSYPLEKSKNIKDADLLLRGWDKYPELMIFLKRILEQDRYHDLHGGNIMKNVNDEYRLIDLEGFISHPLLGNQNAWISQYRTNEPANDFTMTFPSAPESYT